MKQNVQLINRPIYTKKFMSCKEMCDKDGASKQRGQDKLFNTWCWENSHLLQRKTRYSSLPYAKLKIILHKDYKNN